MTPTISFCMNNDFNNNALNLHNGAPSTSLQSVQGGQVAVADLIAVFNAVATGAQAPQAGGLTGGLTGGQMILHELGEAEMLSTNVMNALDVSGNAITPSVLGQAIADAERLQNLVPQLQAWANNLNLPLAIRERADKLRNGRIGAVQRALNIARTERFNPRATIVNNNNQSQNARQTVDQTVVTRQNNVQRFANWMSVKSSKATSGLRGFFSTPAVSAGVMLLASQVLLAKLNAGAFIPGAPINLAKGLKDLADVRDGVKSLKAERERKSPNPVKKLIDMVELMKQ